ncbi:uncharacterized protein IWZ02DRAFT_463935 [Phyllosticta citriasiana]|uniref:Uncharacterized protein n=1 Tax=Phyllosticta citriasiana TaxID=595635 RepID=A0ABR1KCY9_9PEZI
MKSSCDNMKAPTRSKRLCTLGLILALVVFFLCTIRPKQHHQQQDLDKRGGSPDLTTDIPIGKQWNKGIILGPAEEPVDLAGRCDPREWVFWLSFTAHKNVFKTHRKDKQITCIPNKAWKSDACTRWWDKPFSWDFKTGCQRRDFARLNLKPYREELTQEAAQKKVNLKEYVRRRFLNDLRSACKERRGSSRAFCRVAAFIYGELCKK